MSEKRESNIELLRIISMLMIVSAHFAAHGIMKINSENSYVDWINASPFNQNFIMMLIPGGKVGVGLFFVITGFFLGRSGNRRINGSISFFRKIFESIIFYAISITIISVVLFFTGIYYQGASFVTLFYSYLSLLFAPINSQAWWYVTSYIVLLLFVPYTQTIIERLKTKGYIFILAFLAVFELIIPFMLQTSGLPIVRSLFFYFLGAYFYLKSNSIVQIKRLSRISLVLLLVFLWVTGAFINKQLYIYNFNGMVGAKERVIYCIFSALTAGIIYPICSGIIFIEFLTMKIPNIKLINYIASLTFGIYLLHDNNLFRPILWEKILNVSSFLNSKYFLLFTVLSIVGVFVLCGIIESFRKILMEKCFYQLNDRIFKRITNCLFYDD